jgi:mannose-6-phosphate isomerase-like protein (cupin superfamily)
MTQITIRTILLGVCSLFAVMNVVAADGGSTIISKREVNEVLLQGLDNLARRPGVSDIVVRHLNVGEENIGVSVVQRSKIEVEDTKFGIAHPDLDEIYYIVAGTGTMVTGGEFVNKQSNVSPLLGPMDRGEIRGYTYQYVEPGDIAIIPKGMPHGWHKIDTDNISYIIFRGDPHKVMEEKTE